MSGLVRVRLGLICYTVATKPEIKEAKCERQLTGSRIISRSSAICYKPGMISTTSYPPHSPVVCRQL